MERIDEVNKNVKLAIYGTGVNAKILVDYAKTYNREIKYLVNSSETCSDFRGYEVRTPDKIDFNEIDYLIISSNLYYEDIMQTIFKKVTSAIDNITRIIDFDKGLSVIQNIEPEFEIIKLVDGTNWLYRATDVRIGPYMKTSGKVFVQEYIDEFISRVNANEDESIFLDIGANIGTTSIYVANKYKNIKVIGFEPGKQNYDMFRVNCILNGVENISIEKYAISDFVGKMYFEYVPYNPGMSRCVEKIDRECGYERVNVTTIDEYINNGNIDAKKIKYMWIDVEGMESEVIIGAKQLIRGTSVPIFFEFNAESYIRRNKMEELIEILVQNYNYFIDFNNKKSEKIPISKIRDFAYKCDEQKDILVI